ncbi:iron uptake transporter deferrochelatase/peroxidase subunit [uncultured Tolumonas sp.]|uniref:iron uptake transporter deferrochelatase/peroxidase subunit n=1 Tax=uncultured Tolumonas sp. TaxID=263765 RepID=UPI0037486FA8
MGCPFSALWQTVTGKSMKAPHPVTEHNTEELASPSRRSLLMGLGAAGGALALGGLASRSALAAPKPAAILPGDAKLQKQPFYGQYQRGITTPQQAAMMLVAFDILATNKADLTRLFKLLTERCVFLMQGGQPVQVDNKLPPLDSGIMGTQIYPDNLTITVSVGNSLFDDRFGLAGFKPKHLQQMTKFPNDSLDAKWCHGDLLLQICANSSETVLHALRDIIKHTPDLLSVRWRRDGFISAHAAATQGQETPINLLGFKDGTGNPDTHQQSLMNKILWVNGAHREPAWATHGSYQAIRLIRFRVEFWDRTPLQEQEAIFGRHRDTGAPLGKRNEHDDPDYASDPEGKRIPLDSHIRLANPRTPETEKNLILRRGYSYSSGITGSGQLDMGLLFVCYQADLTEGFIAVQKKLDGEPLEEYIKPFGGGYFFTLPGVPSASHYFAQTLLEAV